jgi:hypothetical protein
VHLAVHWAVRWAVLREHWTAETLALLLEYLLAQVWVLRRVLVRAQR